eukprot:1160066-Pelagomonas_calceolata.AAC.4
MPRMCQKYLACARNAFALLAIAQNVEAAINNPVSALYTRLCEKISKVLLILHINFILADNQHSQMDVCSVCDAIEHELGQTNIETDIQEQRFLRIVQH